MTNIFETLTKVLQQDERLITKEGQLIRNRVHELIASNDENLLELLLKNDVLKSTFFLEIKGKLVYKKDLLLDFMNMKSFLPDSFTKYTNKIGLANENEKLLSKGNDVSLIWPHKDCVLQGGMTQEDQSREEVFYNEILAPDEISSLFRQKAFRNFRKIDSSGTSMLTNFTRSLDGTITDNLVVKGNNLLVLNSLLSNFEGKVKLIYIDPPYNTEKTFAYNDTFKHSTWLTFMKNRLEIAKKLLTPDGSIYVNIDYNEAHYLKVLMDEIFGRASFQREIIWRIGWLSGFKTGAKNYIRNHDTILFYTRDPKNFTFNKSYTTPEDYEERFNQDELNKIEDQLKSLNPSLDKTTRKEFLKFVSGVGLPDRYPLEDTWNSSPYDKLNSIALVSYSGEKVSKMLGHEEIKGQKPEKLLQRIIETSTSPGEIVLDFHLGSGTTAAAAHKLDRQYIGIEQMDYIETAAVARLKEVISGEGSGISKKVSWSGGGQFVYFELAESNESYVVRIDKASSDADFKELFTEITTNAFLSHRLDVLEVASSEAEFMLLDKAARKNALMVLLDKNNLYVNYDEINDPQFPFTQDEIALNSNFYGAI